MSPSRRGSRRGGPDAGEPTQTSLLSGENAPYLPAAHLAERADASPGFQLRRLVLRGANVEPAELRLRPGLNVVVGPSNTGKSFAFYLLDFLFGAQSLRKRPAEAAHYDEAVLEIETDVGETFTVRRPLGERAFRWYDVPVDRAGGPGTKVATLALRHAVGRVDTISAQYLALSGLADRRLVRSRQAGTTQPLSFRNVVRLTMIDEARILSDGSPVRGANRVENPAEESLFALLVTGRDASDLVVTENPEARRGRLQAQADLLDTLIARLDAEVEAGDPRADREGDTAAEIERQRAALDATIGGLEAELAASAQSMEEAIQISAEAGSSLVRLRSRLLVVRELLGRFDLLRQSYETDLARLRLIADGNDLLEQLPPVVCPTCGQQLGGVHDHPTSDPAGEGAARLRVTASDALPGQPLGDEVRAACAGEARTIRGLLADLRGAVADLRTEEADLAEEARESDRQIRELDGRVREQFRPRLVAASAELRRAVAARQQVLSRQGARRERARLVEERYEITRQLDAIQRRQPRGPAAADEAPEPGTEALATAVRELLLAWQLPDVGSVRFDRAGMDLVVGGRPRADQGKGVRALWFSAFVIGLMRACRREGRPHPGFVVLDSPLTTFRGGVRPARGPDDVPETIEQAFFRSLATTSAHPDAREQIVVFENKEPPDDIAAIANVVRFSGAGGDGREGFVPSPVAPDARPVPQA